MVVWPMRWEFNVLWQFLLVYARDRLFNFLVFWMDAEFLLRRSCLCMASSVCVVYMTIIFSIPEELLFLGLGFGCCTF